MYYLNVQPTRKNVTWRLFSKLRFVNLVQIILGLNVSTLNVGDDCAGAAEMTETE